MCQALDPKTDENEKNTNDEYQYQGEHAKRDIAAILHYHVLADPVEAWNCT